MAFTGNAIQASDSPSIDAFARWRVSNPETIFDSKQLFDNAPLFWDDQQISGTATSVYTKAHASTVIGVGNATAGRRIRQTFMRFNYQPAKSQLVFMTGTLGAIGGGNGITRSMGQYDDENGIFTQDDEGVLKFVIRSSYTGSVVDNKVAQSSWNLDKLDGTGSSGITIDGTKSQILIIDYEWLGVGRVRIGFVFNGIPVYCHEFLHANNEEGVYMSTPNNPLRYEIENDGTGVASDLEHICSSVISEGGVNKLGITRHVGTEGVHVDCNVENTLYAIIGIKLKSTHLGATIELIKSSIGETAGNKDYEWELVFNPTVAGTFTYANVTDSSIMFATGDSTTTVTGGTSMGGGQLSSASKGGADSSELDSALRLGATISGTVDEIVLCVRPVGGSTNIDIEGSLTYKDLS